MPELPEVEHLRRSLDPWVVGCRFGKVSVRRRSVVSFASDELRGDLDAALLANSTIVETHRHGKQMALEALNGRVLVIQLGMTGSVTIERGGYPRGMDAKHRHVVWEFMPSPASVRAAGVEVKKPWRLVFRDPRRFGGLTAYPSFAALKEAWCALGHDAANPSGSLLKITIEQSKRPIKSALLDQAVIAGLGNIYADEALFASQIHPLRSCNSLKNREFHRLTAHIRQILGHAILAGGSTLRDYRDAFGQPGDAVQSHKVYGRGGEPCLRCSTILESIQLGGRTTVFCPRCQDLSTSEAKAPV